MHNEMASDAPGTATTEARWSAWTAKGIAHDRKTKIRTVALAAAVAAGLALWLAMVLLGN